MQRQGWFCPHCGLNNGYELALCGGCRGMNPFLSAAGGGVTSAPIQVDIGRSRGVYIVLALFLGCLGIHNFYAGRNGIGLVQFVVFVTLFWTLIVPLGLVILSVVEVIAVTHDGDGRPMR